MQIYSILQASDYAQIGESFYKRGMDITPSLFFYHQKASFFGKGVNL